MQERECNHQLETLLKEKDKAIASSHDNLQNNPSFTSEDPRETDGGDDIQRMDSLFARV